MTDLAKFAASLPDDNVVALMVRMSKNGQRATRAGDVESVEKFQKAYDVYHAEARKRGLIS